MLRDIFDLIKFILLSTPFVVAIFAVVIYLGNKYSSYQCSNYSRITGKETIYAEFDTCYIKSEQGYQRWDEYKARAIASDGLSK